MQIRLSKAQKVKIKDTEDVYKIMQRVLLRDNKLSREKERFWVIGLAKDQTLLYVEMIALGKKNIAFIEPMDVYSLALTKKSSFIILCHNHPSGNLLPSPEDIKLTSELLEGGKLIKIRVIDHLIISEKKYYSFAEKGIIK